MPEFETMMMDDEDLHYSLSLRSKTAKQHRSWLLRRAPVAAGSARLRPRPCFPLASLQNRQAASIMVAAMCSCRSGLGACLFFHPERREGSLRSSRKLILKIIVTSRRCVPRTSSIERCHVELNHPLAIGFPRCTRDKGKSAILKKSSSPSGPCPSSRLAGRSRA
jgi:hypothetical protein